MNYIKYIRSKVGHGPLVLTVVIGLAEEKGKLLFVKKRGEKTWGLPGGFMEVGETAEETLKREIKEETGLKASATGLLGVYTNYPLQKYPNGDKAHVVHIVLTCKVSGTPTPDGDEIEQIKFTDKYTSVSPRHKILLRDYLSGKRGVVK
jgi:ADP-ribose pyrophosphatase YjhB (NUDIX family)